MSESVKVIAIVEGGVLQSFIAGDFVHADTFDWDNFEADPIGTWESFSLQEFLKESNPELYKDILTRYHEAQAELAADAKIEAARMEAISQMN